MVSHFLDSCFRRNDIEQPKLPFTVIPAKAGIHFQELHKMLVYKKVRKYRYTIERLHWNKILWGQGDFFLAGVPHPSPCGGF